MQEADLICRYEKLVVSAVLNAQVVAVHTCHLERLHAEVFPDAVRYMDNVVAGRNLAKVTDALPCRRCAPQLCLVAAEDILLRKDGNLRCAQLKTRTQRTRCDGDGFLCLLALPAQDDGGDLPPHQHIADGIRTLHAAREHKHLRPIHKITAQLALEQGELPLKRRHRHHLKVDERRRYTVGIGAAHQRGKELMPCRPCRNHFRPREEACRAHLVLLCGVRKRCNQTRWLIEQRDSLASEIRQKARLPLIIRCTQRHDGSRADIFDGALRQRVVLAHGVDLRIEEFHADGRERVDGEDVDNAAAHAELPDVLHLRHMLVAERSQALEQRIARQFLTEAQGERGARELRRAQPPLRRRADLREHDDRLMPQETREDVHALRRALEPLRSAGRSKVHAIQFRQFVDIRLRQK